MKHVMSFILHIFSRMGTPTHLNDVDFFPSIVPHLKLLNVTFHILCDSNRTHLWKKQQKKS